MIETLLQVTSLSGTTIYLDLYDDVSINLNLSFAEIQDITTRNSGYSQTFRVPGTPKNNEFFNYMFNVNQEGLSFDLQKSVICSVNYKGVEIMSGVLRLLKVIINNNKVDYEVNIQDEVGVFINSLSNKLLIDIDYSDLDHTYNSTNVKLSWEAEYTGSATTGGLLDGAILYPFSHNGYLYNTSGSVIVSGSSKSPLLELAGDVGSISNINSPMVVTGFKPSIQINQVVQRIFNQNGYNVISSFFETEYYKRLYMPLLFNSDTYFINSTGGTNGSSSVTMDVDFEPQGFFVSGSTCLHIEGYVPWNDLISNNGPTYGPYGWNIDPSPFVSEGRYIIYANGDYTFNFNLDLIIPPAYQDGLTYIKGDVYYLKNRTTKFNIQSYDTSGQPFGNWGTQVSDLNGTTITLAQNDFIELVVTSQVAQFAGNCGGSYKYNVPEVVKNTSVMNITEAPNIVIGSTINIGEQFGSLINPEYKQLDFIKGIITQFNMVFVKHPYLGNTYIMEVYDDYVGQGVSLDWTNKLDKSKTIEISPITNITGKAIDLTYKEDADSTNTFTKAINNNKTFGTMNFIPSGVTINDDSIKIESFFSPTPCDLLSYARNPNPFIVPQFYSSKGITISGVTITQLLPMKIKPRILHYYGMRQTSTPWYYYDEITTGTTEYYTYPLLHHQNTIPSSQNEQAIDLNFGNSSSPQDVVAPTQTINTAYNLYYKEYVDDLLSEEARMVSASFYLTIQDIINLQYDDLIFVKDAFYRINKISNFNLINNQTTRVELVKLLRVDISEINPTPVDVFCNLQTELVEDIQDELENNLGPEQCEVPVPPS